MRSAVSVILSTPAPESNMSHPDYRQTAHDHASLLILVRHLGSKLNSRTFSRLYERISRHNTYKIKDSSGTNRTIFTRYVRSYPVENNEWGDFQTHRRVLGLICIGQCTTTQEVSELCRIHESLRAKYDSTLYDSRCIFLGLQHDGTPYTSGNPVTPTTNGSEELEFPETVGESNGAAPVSKYHDAPVEIHDLPSGDDVETNSASNVSISKDSTEDKVSVIDLVPNKISHPTRTLYYPSLDKCSTLEADLQDFVSSLFWVLESKRLVALSNADKEKQPLLCAPFERKDLIGMDLESRTHRKRNVGRWRKQLGDLTLQAGLITEALEHYQTAAELLRPVNDWLWLAGAFEGSCAASVLLLYPHLHRPAVIQRIGSLTGDGLGGKTRCSSILSSSGGLRSLPVDLDSTQNFLKNRLKFKFCLGPEEILDKYHEAVVHYSKYRNAGVIETEASIKAVHVLIEQRKYLSAAEFLQNVVFINLQLSDEEKIQRFTALSELYNQLGFHRKSSFFRRVSAMRCVAPQTTIQPNWNLCYQLLLESLTGYKLSLDTALVSSGSASGWPALQVQILQELIGTARRLGNVPLAIRHAGLLVHLLLLQQHQGACTVLSPQEQCELARQLELLSQRCETPLHPGPLALDNGTIIPPVPWSFLPKIRSFKLQQPEVALKAQKLQIPGAEDANGPFLFTPIQFGSFRKQPSKKTQIHMDFQWVEGDHCEVVLQAINPAPFELRISNMVLLTEGIDFDAQQASLTIPPSTDNSTTSIILSGIPRSSGQLKITGYSTTVLGLKNHCKLKSALPTLGIPFFSIDVVPALPRLQVHMSSNNVPGTTESQGIVASTSIQLYAGQSTECNLTIINTSNVPVESFELELVPSNRAASSDVFSFSLDNLKAQLPLQPGAAASVTVYIHGAGDFIMPAVSNGISSLQQAEDLSSIPSLSGPSSLFSRISNPIGTGSSTAGISRNKTKRTESLVSVRSGASSIRSGGSSGQRIVESSNSSTTIVPKTIEALLKLQYSGGPGQVAGYCRSCTVSLSVDILPSIVITKWDVLPAEIPSHCYLVLDIFNAAAQEMELHYSSTKHIAIEALDTCRIPVPVERCPLAKLSHIYTECGVELEQQHEEIAKICSEHLASLVELKWSLLTSNVNAGTPTEEGESSSSKTIMGKASLNGLRCSMAMLDLLHVSPIQFELQLNGETWSPERAELSCVVGDILDVTVTILNALSTTLGPLALQVSVSQDLQNGTSHRRLETRLLIIGSDCAFLDKVEANDSYKHECSIAFFTPGIYKLDIVCSLLPGQTSCSTKLSPLFELPSYQHAWKFVPAVEMVVKDM